MGTDIVLGWTGQTTEERAALWVGAITADKVGHLRDESSEVSFTNWAESHLGGRSLYWIFDYDDDKTSVVGNTETGEQLRGYYPDWESCRRRAEKALELAKNLDDQLFISPLRVPSGDPQKFPNERNLLDVYRADQKELTTQWSKFTGSSPPLKTANGRFSANWVKIKAVMWCQQRVYKPGSPPTIEIQPVMVCEGPPDYHQHYIIILEATIRLIDFGQEKNGWLEWY